MPSLEIACLGLDEPVKVPAKGFAVECEPGLVSRCVPSRFQKDFDHRQGCLYRIGHPSRRDPRRGATFSAYQLLSAASREPFPPSFLEFRPEHVGEIDAVLSGIMSASPSAEVLFTSDWQFGPEWTHRFGPLTLKEFWRLHASRTLYLNTAYTLAG
jgi:hypothetical protein